MAEYYLRGSRHLADERHGHQQPGGARHASTDWTIAGVGDFDGNGKADILWRNTTSGAVAIWLMNGTAISSQGVPGTAPLVWQIQ